MNIKSLLLGSAAALVAVSGARAADVIMPVAPEPVDYVRVCDVYGTGFYYIPGTETCLSISGYVRFQYNVAGGIEDNAGNDFLRNSEGDDYQAGSVVRVRLNIDAREETELGTLRAFARLQAQNSFGTSEFDDGFSQGSSAVGTDAGYFMDMGFIQLGGLTMGYLDTLWTEGDGLLTDTDLPVGDFQINRVSYTYAANGFTAALSLEDDDTGDFAPDVVGRLAYAGGWGSVYIAGSYDESAGDGLDFASFANNDEAFVIDQDPTSPTFGTIIANPDFGFGGVAFGLNPNDDDGAFALKAGLSLKDLIAADSELKIEGSYAFDPSSYSTLGIFSNAASIGSDRDILVGTLPVEWQIGAGYAQQFGKLGVAVAGVYGETFDYVGFTAPGTFASVGNGEYYKLVGNVGYEITNNFDMLAEVSYANIDFNGEGVAAAEDGSIDQTAGFLRFVRSF